MVGCRAKVDKTKLTPNTRVVRAAGGVGGGMRGLHVMGHRKFSLEVGRGTPRPSRIGGWPHRAASVTAPLPLPAAAAQALDVTTLTIMRILPREVDPVVFNMTQVGCAWAAAATPPGGC